METFLEILKLTIPGLISLATAYLLLKSFLDDKQLQQRTLFRQESLKLTLPIRLQAYERLLLLCERASITNTLLRIRMPGMNVAELRGALMVAISQEFDHNTSQQLYCTDTLWKIIGIAKADTLSLIATTATYLDPKSDSEALVSALLEAQEQRGHADPLQRAVIAIRTEAGQLF
jgi:hypothetical protein